MAVKRIMGQGGEYWVDTDRLTCTCPDFKYRRRQRGEWCKHLLVYAANRKEETNDDADA